MGLLLKIMKGAKLTREEFIKLLRKNEIGSRASDH
jgi:hypothetical protein